MEENKKISYNPFKMWGSWVGGIAGLALSYFLVMGMSMGGEIRSGEVIIILVIGVLGFLMGAWIHKNAIQLINNSANQ